MQTTIGAFISQLVPDVELAARAGELSGMVTGMIVRRDDQLRIDCLLDQPCPGDLLCSMEQALEQNLPTAEVIIAQRFGQALSETDGSRYAASLSAWILRHLWHQDAFLASLLSQAEFCAEQGSVLIHLHDECCEQFEESQLELLQNLFERHVAAKTRFRLAPSGNHLAEYTQQMINGHHARANEIHAAGAAEKAAADQESESAHQAREHGRQTGQGARRKAQGEGRPRFLDRNSGVIWGRIRTELKRTAIAELNSESGLVLLEGEVFNLECRAISNGTRVLVKFALTDFSHSVNCIVFIKPEEQDMLENSLKGAWIRCAAEIAFDSQFAKDLQAKIMGIQMAERQPDREDKAPLKRIELHAHTKMSAKDALCDPAELVRQAAAFGHPAIALTDHGVVQAFPEAADARDVLQEKGIQIQLIFGMEGYLVDDGSPVAWLPDGGGLEDGFVAVDVETTGLDPAVDRIIEIAAVWFRPDGTGRYQAAESLTTLVNPGIPVSPRSQELTGISTDMLRDAPSPLDAVRDLVQFVGERPVVAHNAFFDIAFIRYEGFRTPKDNGPRIKFNPPLVDTLALARFMLPTLANHKLNTVAEHLQISLDQHHRAGSDAETCGMIFAELLHRSHAEQLDQLNGLAGCLSDEEITGHRRTVSHIILLAADPLGLYNLYRLVSISHLRYFHSRPRIPRSMLQYFRTGLIVGSACESGEIFQGVLAKYRECGNDFDKAAAALRDPALVRLGRFYDYLEIQPNGNNAFYLRDPTSGLQTEEDLARINQLIIRLGRQLGKPVCATCDVHFLEKRDAEYRRILMADAGYEDAHEQPDLFLRTTGEMLAEFPYLEPEQARAVVIDGPRSIAARISSQLRPFPTGSFPPAIATAADDVREQTWAAARARFAHDGRIPDEVVSRIERELTSIIDNGFAVMYDIACRLVRKSNEDGYLVGSRGSVGSSLVAFLCGITEVNPLPPHYFCPSCHYSEFENSGAYGSGYDLPAKSCPVCGAQLGGDGQDIPFETFLGFHGDKQPDIDLNFSGEYQGRAHKFIEEMFGSSHTFRAGTIGSYAEKNAQAIVANYFKEREQYATQAEISRLSRGLIGVKRTTGQHPGGIVVVPKDREIYDFTPVQYPADKTNATTITTHFDFNALHDTILKLDVLGHDDPTMLKMLGDLTGIDVRAIPIPDARVMSLFHSTEALGIPDGTAPTGTATLGLPEMGTFMAREMIRETQPDRVYDIIQLMGLSHGTDVWKGNAQDLIKSGTCTLEEVIGCRDSIMTYLIYRGLPAKASFDIMEGVRRGRGLKPEQEALMQEKGVPAWYIESCKKIRYMFPKAHAAAYTISALRIAWFKVYRPLEYYCAYFTVRADEFDSSRMCLPPDQVRQSREQLYRRFREVTDREQKIYYILEMVEEMQLRGIDFAPIDLEQSEATHFIAADTRSIRPPLNAIPSISAAMAESVARARLEGPFKNRDELMQRTGLGQAAIEALAEAGCLESLPESAQIDMFEWLN